MPHVRFDFRVFPAPLEAVVAQIIRTIPGAKITAEDWYVQRLTQEMLVIERLRKDGQQLPFENEILDSIRRAGKSAGPTMGITIPAAGGDMNGRISRDFMLLHSNMAIRPADAERLLSVFASFGISASYSISDSPSKHKVPENG